MFYHFDGRMSEDYEGPVPGNDLLFNVEMALRKASALWPRKHVPGDHDRFRPLAKAVVEHLELCGMVFFRKAPSPPHSTLYTPPSRVIATTNATDGKSRFARGQDG